MVIEKVKALINALNTVREHTGFAPPWEIAIERWLGLTDPSFVSIDADPQTAHAEVLAAAAEFVKAVELAEMALSSIPVPALEPLSAFTSGVRWDIQMRRTLKLLQRDLIELAWLRLSPDVVLAMLRRNDNANFVMLQSKLKRFARELRDRVLDLESLHSDHTRTIAKPKNLESGPEQTTFIRADQVNVCQTNSKQEPEPGAYNHAVAAINQNLGQLSGAKKAEATTTTKRVGGRPVETTRERAEEVNKWWGEFLQGPMPEGYECRKPYRKGSSDDFLDWGKFKQLPNFPTTKAEVEKCKKRYRDLNPQKSAKTKPSKRG